MSATIKTANVFPPIPDRSHDWCAWRDGTDECGPFGWGRTEDEAVCDLISNYEPPFDCVQDDPRVGGK